MGLARAQRIGRYELLVELGRGGMAELFLAHWQHDSHDWSKLVAIKRILPQFAQDAQFREMFLNEGRIAARMSHANVCQVFELDEVDGDLFLAMEYLEGVSWDQLIAALPPDAPRLALASGVIAQAAEGLHYAHCLRDVAGNPTPVIHRDVSPHNLFLTVDGVCKVLDFGVSKMMTDGPRTRSGVIKGKLPYMSPEQIRGEDLDGRADVFALGVCAWEALAGRRLFDRTTDFQIWKAITEEDVPSIATSWPACPPGVDAVVRRALDRERERRHASTRDFADELRIAAGGSATPAAIGEAVRLWCADKLAGHARDIATAVAAHRNELDPDAAKTLEVARDAAETASMLMRQQSLKVDRPSSDAAATRDLRSGPQDAAVTLDERSGRALRPTRVEDDDDEPLVPARSQLRTVILAALVGAGIAAAIVIYAMSRDSAKPRAHEDSASEASPDDGVATVTAPPRSDGLQDPWAEGDRAATTTPRETASDLQRGLEQVTAAGEDVRKAGDELRKAGDDIRKATAKLRGGSAPLRETSRRSGSTPSGSTPSGSAPSAAAPPVGSAPPNETPPPVATPAKPGFLTVDSQPFATIYIDGVAVGQTPLFRAPLAPGKRRLRAVLADGRVREMFVDITAENATNVGKLTW